MKKTKVVIFQDSYARILTNPDLNTLNHLKSLNIPFLINPDLSGVNTTPLQYWKLKDDKVILMTENERLERDLDPELNIPFEPLVIIKEIPVFSGSLLSKWVKALFILILLQILYALIVIF